MGDLIRWWKMGSWKPWVTLKPLSHNHYIIMYMCQQPITSLKKGISSILFTLMTFEKDAFYVMQSKLKKENNKQN